MDAAQLELDKQELQLDAQKVGAKLAADRRKDSARLELDVMKTTVDTANKRKKE